VTTAQDLLSDLGPPLRTFYKEDDRMAIHARSHNEDENPELSCTLPAYLVLPFRNSMLFYSPDFYNYFQHGIDFLLSDHTHIVKKIILHSNVVSVFVFRRPSLV
jgi:phagosome assembly factor 1